MSIEALIFDFDGLIQDTENAEFQAWQEVVRARGHEFTPQLFGLVLGNKATTEDAFHWMRSQYDWGLDPQVDLPALVNRSRELRLQQSPRAGVLDYIKTARQLNLSLAIASSSNREWIDFHLQHLNLADQFDWVLTADDVTNIKPDPDLYLLALQRLGINAKQAVVFEDSPTGITAAKAAGIFAVAVPNEVSRNFSFDHADMVISSMADYPLPNLLEKINHHPLN